jgi:hypothetical protein
VPNTKVVANIQIYLHAKFHIFLISPSISPILSPPADLFNWKKELDWKNRRGSFSPWPAQLGIDPAHLRKRVGLPAVIASPSLTDGARLSAPSSPKSFPAPHRVSSSTNSCRQADHPSSACTTSTSTCPPAVVSHRIGCGAPWRPITAARCSATARRCSSRDAHARSSTMRSQIGCLVPPCPILSLLADDCRLYHHLTSAAPSPFRCSSMTSLRGRDARAKSSTAMSHAAPLLPPSLLTPHVSRLASSSLAPHRIGTMRWHACMCRMATSIHPLVQLTSSPTAYGQTPSVSPPGKAATTAMSLLCLAARVSTLALPPH